MLVVEGELRDGGFILWWPNGAKMTFNLRGGRESVYALPNLQPTETNSKLKTGQKHHHRAFACSSAHFGGAAVYLRRIDG